MARSYGTRRLSTFVAAACVLALALTGSLWWVTAGPAGTVITGFFSRSVGIYEGSDVKVLGIEVGEVRSVQPQGDRVKVDFTVDPSVAVPANAKAVMVSPSLVSDRYIQLTPPYESGPTLDSGAVLPRERTAMPMEIDELYSSVNELSETLGPNGANSDGALSDALDTAAANLSGNGERAGKTIERLGQAAEAMANSRGDLFATVDNLSTLTETLAASDQDIQAFSRRLAGVSDYLADDGERLGQALSSLAGAMGRVQGFLADNKDLIKSNVHKLTGVTEALVEQRDAIAEIVDIAPTGLTNYLNTYDAASGAFAVRWASMDLSYPPALLLCRTIKAGTPNELPDTIANLCSELAPLINGALDLPSPAEVLGAIQQGKLPPLPLPLADTLEGLGLPLGGDSE